MTTTTSATSSSSSSSSSTVTTSFWNWRQRQAAVEAKRRLHQSETFTRPLGVDAAAGTDQDLAALNLFLKEFYAAYYTRDQQRNRQQLLESCQELAEHYDRLVRHSGIVSEEEFWQRYQFRCKEEHILQEWDRHPELGRAARSAALTSSFQSLLGDYSSVVQAVKNVVQTPSTTTSTSNSSVATTDTTNSSAVSTSSSASSLEEQKRSNKKETTTAKSQHALSDNKNNDKRQSSAATTEPKRPYVIPQQRQIPGTTSNRFQLRSLSEIAKATFSGETTDSLSQKQGVSKPSRQTPPRPNSNHKRHIKKQGPMSTTSNSHTRSSEPQQSSPSASTPKLESTTITPSTTHTTSKSKINDWLFESSSNQLKHSFILGGVVLLLPIFLLLVQKFLAASSFCDPLLMDEHEPAPSSTFLPRLKYKAQVWLCNNPSIPSQPLNLDDNRRNKKNTVKFEKKKKRGKDAKTNHKEKASGNVPQQSANAGIVASNKNNMFASDNTFWAGDDNADHTADNYGGMVQSLISSWMQSTDMSQFEATGGGASGIGNPSATSSSLPQLSSNKQEKRGIVGFFQRRFGRKRHDSSSSAVATPQMVIHQHIHHVVHHVVHEVKQS